MVHMMLPLVNIQVVIFQISIVTVITFLHLANFQMNFIQMLFHPEKGVDGKVTFWAFVFYSLPKMASPYVIKHIFIC